MTEFSQRLKPFARRVRLVRGWIGLAMGACIGSAIAVVWATSDYFGWFYAQDRQLAWPILIGALIGSLGNALRPVSERALTLSVERRAGLSERVSTAQERSGESGAFDAALREDANRQLGSANPRSLYPFRWLRWHSGTLAMAALAAGIFLLGNQPIMLSEKAKQDREAVKREGKKVERVRKENLEDPKSQGELGEAERRLADKMRRLQQELEKARMSPEEARQKANELGNEARELMRKQAGATQQSLAKAETAREQFAKKALEQAGHPDVEPAMAAMTPEQRDTAMQQAKSQMEQAQNRADQLQKEMDALRKKLASGKLSSKEAKEAEEQLAELEKQQKAAQNAAKAAQDQLRKLQLSKEAMDTFAKMMQTKEFQELQRLAQKLAKNAQKGEAGQAPSLTAEELRELHEQLEALAKQLQDPEAMKAYLDALREALKNGLKQCRMGGVGFGLSLGLGMNGPSGPGMDNDTMLLDSGIVPKSDKPVKGQGRALPTQVKGQIRQAPGEDPYIEIKAPTNIGTRSSVPYVKVLPSYRKKAESALERQQIPKEHQKRVKEYFSSLGK